MAILLGVDTGGAFTDAAIWDEAAGVVLGKAKAPTTPRDLSAGVGRAAAAALKAAGVAPGEVAMAALSTTLATNALVEGHGDAAALVMIGFAEADLTRAGLGAALGDDPAILIAGGHDGAGRATAPLDLDQLAQAVRAAAPGVAAFAVAGMFAVRNPGHERAARDLIRRETGLPVSCSHTLSARLGGPKRALTTLLNGRLIGMIDRLIAGTEARLAALGVAAPLMVVRGDGALMRADFARARPIETILSGPAASVVGAARLTGVRDAVISDIGSTTTDIAILSGGRPRIDPDGARVGGWRTMVEAVATRTHGLGGDSEVGLAEAGLVARLTLGPRRAVPVASFAAGNAAIHAVLDKQLSAATPGDHDGVFVAQGARRPAAGELNAREAAILSAVGEDGAALDALALDRRGHAALARLTRAGFLRRVAFTPTDAAHVLGLQTGFDAAAAVKAARLFARRRGNDGRAAAESAEALSRQVIAALRRRSAELILEAGLEADGRPWRDAALAPLASAALDGAALDGAASEGTAPHSAPQLVETRISLTAPLIGLGAPARAHYPDVAAMLRTPALIPEHAEVANAIGAVAGRVEAKAVAVVQSPDGEGFAITLDGAPEAAASEAAALEKAADMARDAALAHAAEAGADAPRVTVSRAEKRAEIEGRDTLLEATVTATAVGRPRFGA